MVTTISNQSRSTADAQLKQIMEENERLRAELKKTKPKRLVQIGRILKSKFHDFEANIVMYKTDANGNLIEEERTVNGKQIKGPVFDFETAPAIFSTAQMREFLDGKLNSVQVCIEEDVQP